MGQVRVGSAVLAPVASATASPPPGLEAFYRAEYPRLVAALELVCGDRQAAEDIAQETFVRVWDRWSRVSRLDSPGGWAYRVALNLARSHLRRRGSERRANQRSRGSTSVATPDVASSVAVREAVASLPMRQREALVLRHYLGYSAAAAADLMGVSDGAVRNLTMRAVAELRNRLGDVEILEDAS